MEFTFIRRAAVLLLLVAAGCTVKSTEAPPLSGPSSVALLLNVTAIPDSLRQDGGDQSSIKISAIGPDGQPVAALPIRVDMLVNGVAQDYGSLSARSVVTNSSGVATVIYTAPPSPANGVFGTCNSLPGNCVSIVATATGTNFVTANPQQVQIRLVPTGVILPPASTPVAQFIFTPTPVTLNTPVIFDATSSCAGPLSGGACPSGSGTITSYAWNFGDGTSGTGQSVTHTFSGSGTSFNVSLTVTNDRGVSATTTQNVTVSVSPAPSGDWVFSPASPNVNQTVLFNADAVKAAPGHTLVQFTWNFGDPNATTAGNTASGFQASHIFTGAGTFTVVLSVADETGQKTVLPKTVVIGTGNPTPAITFSPSAPARNTTVNFSSGGSTTTGGASISTYAWDFGDGTSASTANPQHIFTAAGSYTVRLTITDSQGRSGTTTTTVTVS